MIAASMPVMPVIITSLISISGWKLSSDSTAFSPLNTARASKPAWLRIIAKVLAITCSSSATSTLGLDVAAVVGSAMLDVPKFEGKSSVFKCYVHGHQLVLEIHNNDTLSAGQVDTNPHNSQETHT